MEANEINRNKQKVVMLDNDTHTALQEVKQEYGLSMKALVYQAVNQYLPSLKKKMEI